MTIDRVLCRLGWHKWDWWPRAGFSFLGTHKCRRCGKELPVEEGPY